MIPRRPSLRALAFSALLALGGCSFFEGGEPSKPATPSEDSSQSSDAALTQPKVSRPESTTGVEVLWEIPQEAVDGFVVRYGYDRSHMDHELKLTKADVSEVNDPEFGRAFRYVIQPTASEKPLFVSIASYKGELISDFSEVIEEKAASFK